MQRRVVRGARLWWRVAAAAVLTLAAGIGYRNTAAAIHAELAETIRLPRPLTCLSQQIGDWDCEDLPVREGVQKVAMNDDFVNRRYRQRHTGEAANLYIAYTARPRTMLRHRPTGCYPSAGWAHVGTRVVPLGVGTSVPWPVLIHEFLKPGALTEARVIVLNYYVLNGRVTVDEQSFWSLRWRDPNPKRDPTRYVAQVQVMAPAGEAVENAERVVKEFAAASAEAILQLLPQAEAGAAVRSGAGRGATAWVPVALGPVGGGEAEQPRDHVDEVVELGWADVTCGSDGHAVEDFLGQQNGDADRGGNGGAALTAQEEVGAGQAEEANPLVEWDADEVLLIAGGAEVFPGVNRLDESGRPDVGEARPHSRRMITRRRASGKCGGARRPAHSVLQI